ncbi:MAG: hypothetical protein DMG61_18125 [Acidobacteria bacterium]|nr:MAG: hypothetical protein DMG61_18125 [Acidobacteriota bacterium]
MLSARVAPLRAIAVLSVSAVEGEIVSKASILLADDKPEVLSEVAEILEPDYEIVASVLNGRWVLENWSRLRPDVIVLDISMGEPNGIDAHHSQRSRLRAGSDGCRRFSLCGQIATTRRPGRGAEGGAERQALCFTMSAISGVVKGNRTVLRAIRARMKIGKSIHKY